MHSVCAGVFAHPMGFLSNTCMGPVTQHKQQQHSFQRASQSRGSHACSRRSTCGVLARQGGDGVLQVAQQRLQAAQVAHHLPVVGRAKLACLHANIVLQTCMRESKPCFDFHLLRPGIASPPAAAPRCLHLTAQQQSAAGGGCTLAGHCTAALRLVGLTGCAPPAPSRSRRSSAVSSAPRASSIAAASVAADRSNEAASAHTLCTTTQTPLLDCLQQPLPAAESNAHNTVMFI